MEAIIIKEISYREHLNDVMEQLGKGIFLTVKVEDEINTMTIGWGTIGLIWNKPIFQVLVRGSRHTHELLEKSKEFTVSVPINQDLKQALAFCGTNSGGDKNKLKECNLTAIPGKKVKTPIIGECKRHYECKIIATQKLIEENIASEIGISFYGGGDYHTIFYGEIVASYEV